MWSLKVSQGATGEAEQQQSHQQRAPAMLHSWPDDPTLSQLGCCSPREFGNDWWRWLCCPFTHGMTPENRDLQCLTTLAPWLDIGSLWCIQVPTPFGLESIGAAFLSMAPWPYGPWPKVISALGWRPYMAMAAMGQDPNSVSPKRRQGTWNWIFGCCRARSPRQGHPCDEAPPNAKFPHMGPPNESIQY